MSHQKLKGSTAARPMQIVWSKPLGEALEHDWAVRPQTRERFAEQLELIAEYTLELRTSPDGGGYLASTLEMPSVIGKGASERECVKATIDLVLDAVVSIQQLNGVPPPPAGGRAAETRSVTVSVRMSYAERAALRRLASLRHKNPSEFLREFLKRQVSELEQDASV